MNKFRSFMDNFSTEAKLDPYSAVGFVMSMIGSIFLLAILILAPFGAKYEMFLLWWLLSVGATLFPLGMSLMFMSPYFTSYDRLETRAKKYGVKISPFDLGS